MLTREEKKTGLSIRGYVDDGLLTCRAKDETLSTAKFQAVFSKIEAWASENSVAFDPAKFEAIHFSRKAAFPNPEVILPPSPIANGTGEPRIIKTIAKKASMRWLGIYFDSRFSFSDHAEKMASKRRKAASGLSMLVKTTRGVEALIMQKAVHACILPILTYGAPALHIN